MGAASLPPWLAPWSSSLQLAYSREYKPAPRHRARPRLTIFTYGHGNGAPILSWSEGSPPPGAAPPAGETGGEAGAGWERVPLDRAPWHLDVPREVAPPYDVTIHSDEHSDEVFSDGLSDGSAATRAAALDALGGVLRGWAAGAVLLALLVVVVRIGERYLDWRILVRRRRLHREWQRANGRTNGLDPSGAGRPPPYSACAASAGGGAEPKAREESPPPYAAVHGACKPGAEGGARLLRSCGIDIAGQVLPPPGALDDSFGALAYYAAPPPADWSREPPAPPDGDDLDPPPVYSSADPIDDPTDAEPTDDDGFDDNSDPNYDDVELNDTSAYPVSTEEAPKDGSVAV